MAATRAGRLRFLILAFITAAVLAALVAFQGISSPRTEGEPGSAAAATLTGAYLSGQHARAENDAADAADYFSAALKQRPDDPVLLNRTLAALLIAGRVDAALTLAPRVAKAGDPSPLARMTLAVGDLADGRMASAGERLAAPPPPNFVVPFVLVRAWCVFGDQGLEAGLRALDALKALPGGGEPLRGLHAAWMSDAAGDLAGAIGRLDDVLGDREDVWLRVTEVAGSVYERGGQAEKAIALYHRYGEEHPESRLLDDVESRAEARRKAPREIADAKAGAAEALLDSASLFARQNNREAALILGRLGLKLRPDLAPLQFLVGDLLDSFNRRLEANKIYKSVSRSSILASAARLAVAENLDKLDRTAEAEASLRELARERTSDPQPLSALGDILRQRERYSEAVAVYDESVARVGADSHKANWRLFYARGIALERAKQWARAEPDFLKALELEPDQPFVLNYLGYSWADQGQNLERAEAMLRRAVALRPNDGQIVDSLGWVFYRLGRFDEGVSQLERAVELRPEDAVINDHLGDAYWAVGRQREARYQWRAALMLKPEEDVRASIEQKLARSPQTEASVKP